MVARDNVVFLGPPGTGKTHLAIGLGIRACQAGHRVLFATAAQWVARLAEAHTASRLQAELVRLGRYPLIVVDEVGCAPRGAVLPGGVRDPTTGRRNGRMKLRTADPRRCGRRREQS